jgi:uncharacterized protein (DUF433 family)
VDYIASSVAGMLLSERIAIGVRSDAELAGDARETASPPIGAIPACLPATMIVDSWFGFTNAPSLLYSPHMEGQMTLGLARVAGARWNTYWRVPMKFTRITVRSQPDGRLPCIRGLRIPVATVVGMVADGMTTTDILAAYPDLERDDIQEALHYAGSSAVI